MSVELPKVKEDFTSIVQSLVHHPWKMLQFILWLDLKLAEYKVYGSMMLDSSIGNIPKWLDFEGSCKSEVRCQHPEPNERVSDPSAMPSQSDVDPSSRVSDISPATMSQAETDKSIHVSERLPATPSQSVSAAETDHSHQQTVPVVEPETNDSASRTLVSSPIDTDDVNQQQSDRTLMAAPPTNSEPVPLQWFIKKNKDNSYGIMPRRENSTPLAEEDSNIISSFIPIFRIKPEPTEPVNISETPELPSDTSTNECHVESSGPSISISEGGIVLECENSTGLPEEHSNSTSNCIADFRIETQPEESANISETQELPSDTSTTKCPDGSSDSPMPQISEGETSLVAERQRRDSNNISAGKTYRRLPRPCPFCHKFQNKLTMHIKRRHRDEEDVKNALKLSRNAQNLAFAQMRKQGIYQQNMSLLKSDKPLIRERQHGKLSRGLKMCGTCKAFLTVTSAYRHKCQKNVEKMVYVPVNVLGKILSKKTENDGFQHMLTKFNKDAVGKLCVNDEFIKTVGHGLWQKDNRQPEKKIRPIMIDIRRFASLCLAFKDEAKKDEKEVSTESMLDMVYFSYLEKAIHHISYSKVDGIKYVAKLKAGRLLKRCITIMKATYLVRDEDERADGIDKFEAVLMRRWTFILGDAADIIINKRNSLKRPEHLSMEVENEVVDSSIDQSLGVKEASCSVDMPEENSSLEPGPRATQETRLVADSQRRDSNNISARKAYKRLSRPCPFCQKFQNKLRRHIKTLHSKEQEVLDALKLSGNAQNHAFDQMRKQGIYQQNMSLLKSDKPLIRERQHGKISRGLKMCGTCKAFLTVTSAYRHTCHKNVEKKVYVPVRVLGNILNEETENADFQHMLTKLPTDAVGQLCFGDEFIKTVGRSLWQKNNRNSDNYKQVETRNSTMTDMRRLASLCLAFKDAARKDEKEVSSESMLDTVYFDYLEEAIQQESNSDDNDTKSGLRSAIGCLLKKCITIMKATYLVRDDDERADSIAKFATILQRRWTSIFGHGTYIPERKRRNNSRRPRQNVKRPGQLSMEVEVKTVGSSIENTLEEEASCSADKTLKMPPESTCADVHDGGSLVAPPKSTCADVPDENPADTSHSANTNPDVPEEAGCMKPVSPLTLVGRRYVHWTNAETTLLRNHFHDIIEDCSKTGLKGSLPGYREIQLFLNKHPTVVRQLEDNKEKLKCIKTKLFNERSKQRRSFAAKLQVLK